MSDPVAELVAEANAADRRRGAEFAAAVSAAASEVPVVKRTDYSRGHGYEIEGLGKVPSVTQIIRAVINKSDFLGPWHAKQAVLGCVELRERLGEDYLTRGEQTAQERADAVWGWLKREKLTANDRMNSAGDRGTATHTTGEEYAETGKIPNPADAHPVDRGYVSAMAACLLATKPQIRHSEEVVGSKIHAFAGTADGMGVSGTFPVFDKWEPDKDRHVRELTVENAILDYKTSKRVYTDHRLQLRMYDVAAQEMGHEPADALLIVHLMPDGKWRIYRSHSTAEAAVAAVRWFHALQLEEAA